MSALVDAVPLVDGALLRLGGAIELDGRVSWYPRRARGFAPANAYLLLDGASALLVDTCVPVLERTLAEQLHRLLPDDGELSLLPTRAAEFDSIGNGAAILEEFPVRRVYAQRLVDLYRTIAFQPRFDLPPAETDSSWPLDGKVEWPVFDPGDTIEWTPGRTMELLRTPLKLLITVWPYDAETGTLFTSDAFNHVVRATASESPVLTERDPDPTTVEDVVRHFDSGKFDWLAMADTTTIRDGVEAIFASRTVERIAPSHGCVLDGPEVVERHVGLLLEALERLSVVSSVESR